MKKSNEKYYPIIIITLVVIVFSANISPTASAYWVDKIQQAILQFQTSVAQIGYWNFQDDSSVDPDETIVLPDFLEPPVGSYDLYGNYSESYPAHDPYSIVYDKGDLIFVYQWTNQKELQKELLNCYHTDTITASWKANRVYHRYDIVLFEDILYMADNTDANINSFSGNLQKPDISQNWHAIGNIQWSSSKNYSITGTVVEYQGELYKTKWYSNADHVPPNQNQAYEHLTSIEHTPNKNYNTGDVVRYKGGVYQALQSTNLAPLTQQGHWNRLDNRGWNEYNQYKLNDVVVYQGNVYQVADPELANQCKPDEEYYAWNQVCTPYYNPQNIYRINSVVVDNNIVYRSLKNNNTDDINDESNWFCYIGYGDPIESDFMSSFVDIDEEESAQSELDDQLALPGDEEEFSEIDNSETDNTDENIDTPAKEEDIKTDENLPIAEIIPPPNETEVEIKEDSHEEK